MGSKNRTGKLGKYLDSMCMDKLSFKNFTFNRINAPETTWWGNSLVLYSHVDLLTWWDNKMKATTEENL